MYSMALGLELALPCKADHLMEHLHNAAARIEDITNCYVCPEILRQHARQVLSGLLCRKEHDCQKMCSKNQESKEVDDGQRQMERHSTEYGHLLIRSAD